MMVNQNMRRVSTTRCGWLPRIHQEKKYSGLAASRGFPLSRYFAGVVGNDARDAEYSNRSSLRCQSTRCRQWRKHVHGDNRARVARDFFQKLAKGFSSGEFGSEAGLIISGHQNGFAAQFCHPLSAGVCAAASGIFATSLKPRSLAR